MKTKIMKNRIIGLGPNSRLVKEYKNSLTKLTRDQREASIGLMLGDASLQSQNKGNTYRMKFEWGNKNKPYLMHVYNLFDEWVLSEPHKKSRISPNGNSITNWAFQTISHLAFNELAELFLKDKKKGVGANLIRNHLTEKGLAYWFMDDGGKLDYNLNSKNKSIVLNTQSFTFSEVEMMSAELMCKFNLLTETRLNKNKKIIVIKHESYNDFIKLIDPHIIYEMRYKLP